MTHEEAKEQLAGGGCLSAVVGIGKLVAACAVLWALVAGVEYRGVHYGITCDCDRGVVVEP